MNLITLDTVIIRYDLIPISKLVKCGITGNEYHWFKSNFTNISQYCSVDRQASDIMEILLSEHKTLEYVFDSQKAHAWDRCSLSFI